MCFKPLKNILIIVSAISMLSGCRAPAVKDFRAEVDSLSALSVPDRRLGICDIGIKQGEDRALILTGETTEPSAGNTIIKALSEHGIKVIDSILILPDTISNHSYSGLAANSVINLRKHPDHASELVSQAVLGTPLKILKSEDSWYLVQTPDKYIAWTEMSSVVPMTISEMNRWRHSGRVISVTNSGWIYVSPGSTGVVGDIVAGCIFIKKSESGGYIRVILPDGREGYVSSSSVVDFNWWKNSVVSDEAGIIRIALSYTGLPYLWGGTSSKAVDCSGFVQNIYYLNGILLQRDASQQALHGMALDISKGYGEFRPGDLLFFGSKSGSGMRVTHAAIYLGESEYINSSGRVMINSLDPARAGYSNRESSLLAARRIIGVKDDPGIVQIKLHPWY
jgi:gamma-D-glutamyl-L-lysine dipeptidyl-peptidase